jgi:uncharacterized protein YbjT (DUF2867 family)
MACASMIEGPSPATILLTGATGYVGGRLLRAFEAQGVAVRCATRRPEYLRGQTGPGTEVVACDLGTPDDLRRCLEGIETAYYLAHSMGATGSFEAEDRTVAAAFARAAREAGVRRIIYLGALGAGSDLSAHLASRQEVGRILQSSGVPTIELRSSIIIGAGSLSYDMIRSLVTRLPVMITPRWVRTMTQPIAIDDVIAYLLAARDLPGDATCTYEIGGRDRVSYGDLMREFAQLRGLRRIIVPVPVLSPWLSSLWLGLVTPLYARVGRHLIDGVRNETVVRDERALLDMPVRPSGVRDAITAAMSDEGLSSNRWQDGLLPRPALGQGAAPLKKQMVDSRWVRVPVPPDAAFGPIQRIGGATGWYFGDALWQTRGWLDLAVGGVGMRRGRRHPVDLAPGDMLDFWRVEAIEPPFLLRLIAEMKLPGHAWLQYRVEPDGDGAIIRQTAFFDPNGLRGRLYWLALAPAHQIMFPRMLRGIANAVAPPTRAPSPAPEHR